ncbi:hypothetical protein SEPCBS57363_003671 [Sporothrix epigloea]|uniref:Uncharacterized protein n=1 Tax=Sporothrix epigloea TaxID=1892477 RepID=A0ABP0DMR3_9PEZI
MERDSRRDRGQWRGCHTFENIICDGDGDDCDRQAPAQAPRSGGLKMGRTYYYYYEVDGVLETHDPALPSTTTCPYLPGQRVNTLWIPIERPSLSASSDDALRCCDYRTMDPSDRFLTPRPPNVPLPPTPTTEHSSLDSPNQLLPRQRSARPRSPAASSPCTWSPRRFFARRTRPSHYRSRSILVTPAHAHSGDSDLRSSSADRRSEDRLRIPRLVSSSSCSSFSSFSSLSSITCRRQTPTAGPSSQGTRSRDISPESLRRFLVDDVPPSFPCEYGSAVGTSATPLPTRPDNEDDVDVVTGRSNFLDEDDDDEHNFATSTTSETAPITILSPPPPIQTRLTSPKETEFAVGLAHYSASAGHDDRRTLPSVLLQAPTRAPPAIPMPSPTYAERTDALNQTFVHDLRPVFFPPSPKHSPRLSLILELPPVLPPSPMSFSVPSLSSVSSEQEVSASRATRTSDDNGVVHVPRAAAADRAPIALYLPSPNSLSQIDTGGSMATTLHHRRQQRRQRRHQLVTAALAGSMTTLAPGSGLISADRGSGLDDLIDKLGWMSTAIHG